LNLNRYTTHSICFFYRVAVSSCAHEGVVSARWKSVSENTTATNAGLVGSITPQHTPKRRWTS